MVSDGGVAVDDQATRDAGDGPAPAGKNIIICCDGTGNEVSGNLSNVLKLFRIVIKDEGQRVFYDPGVGTIGTEIDWGRLKANARAVWGLATGAGLDDNILDAYRFLASVYEEGDRVFLFGFSRGAYTVRALAGFISMVGLLRPDQLNIADYALTAYKRTGSRFEAGDKEAFKKTWDFGRTAASRRVTIHFIGAWDTVASMIVPRRDRFLPVPTLRTLPYTRKNSSVRAFRHAMAIDERRRMFRRNRWDEGQEFVVDPFSDPPVKQPQDCRQLWFAGVHADIGGGYPEKESSLSKLPLIWMIEEAVSHGLRIDRAMFDHLARGIKREGATHEYVAPDPCGEMHRSLKGFWHILEWIPKSTQWRRWPRTGFLGFYIPRAEPRLIPTGEALHPSVAERLELCKKPPYRPPNLPQRAPIPEEGRLAPLLRRIVYTVLGVGLLVLVAWGAVRLWQEVRECRDECPAAAAPRS